MRIIDKNTDFYDFLQNMYPDNSLTFDRTDSFVLTKDILCKHLIVNQPYYRRNKEKITRYNFLLLQVNHTFWLFLTTITKVTENGIPIDYDIELIAKWKNYNKSKTLCDLSIVQFNYSLNSYFNMDYFYYFNKRFDKTKLFKKSDVLIKAVDTNNYTVKRNINKHLIYYGNFDKKVEKHIPLLKASGIAGCIDALEIFLSFEEYFSSKKTSSERIEPLGITNNDKIESHGFDTKLSFRNKKM